jgi:hypothetical protein
VQKITGDNVDASLAAGASQCLQFCPSAAGGEHLGTGFNKSDGTRSADASACSGDKHCLAD